MRSILGLVVGIAIAILTIGVVDTLRGRTRFEAFGRTIPELFVERAAVVVFVMFGVVSTVILLLSLTEDAPFRDILFESVSACAHCMTSRVTMAMICLIKAGLGVVIGACLLRVDLGWPGAHAAAHCLRAVFLMPVQYRRRHFSGRPCAHPLIACSNENQYHSGDWQQNLFKTGL